MPRCRFAHGIDIIQSLSRSRPAGRILARHRPNCQTVWRSRRGSGEWTPGLIEDPMATCPECDADVEVDEFDVDKGDQLSCPECGSNLEVTGLSPIELDIAPDDDEEEDDDAEEEAPGDGDDDAAEKEDDDDEDDEDVEE